EPDGLVVPRSPDRSREASWRVVAAAPGQALPGVGFLATTNLVEDCGQFSEDLRMGVQPQIRQVADPIIEGAGRIRKPRDRIEARREFREFGRTASLAQDAF